MSTRALAIILMVIAAVLFLPQLLGLVGFGVSGPSHGTPPPVSPARGAEKFRSTVGEITAGVTTLVESGKQLLGLFTDRGGTAASNRPQDYGSISI